jgi:adenine-specific DNA-methyltransferase
MPSLNWLAKDKIVHHHKDLPFRVLKQKKVAGSTPEADNLVIEGDNLEALKALLPFYYGKIDCIYIDPPYNTGNDKWVYSDRVNSPQIKEWLNKAVGQEGEDLCRHDKWLCMMYPRLKLLRELLAEDGVIFISIDDNEYDNLKFVCDEIFERKNHVATLVWEKKKKGSHLDAEITNIKEYILVFKRGSSFKGLVGQITENSETYPCINPGNGYSLRVIPKGTHSNYRDKNISLPAGHVISSGNMKLTLKSELVIQDSSLQKDAKIEAEWRYQQSSLDRFAADGTLYFTRDLYLRNTVTEPREKKLKDILPRVSGSEVSDAYERLYDLAATGDLDEEAIKQAVSEVEAIVTTGTTNFNNLLADGWGSNEDADNEQRAIFGKKVFDYPKPTKLIKKLIASTRKKNALILDSFAGTGTTGQAVLELNKHDGGNRKFILIELEEKIAKDITAFRLDRVINGFSKALFPQGTQQAFSYLSLNGELFDSKGFINKKAEYADLAAYIFFTETGKYANVNDIVAPFIGENKGSKYFLFFKGINDNVLDANVLKTLKEYAGDKIVFADKVLLDPDELARHRINFKQIPYEMRQF